ncbi:sialate O-acetylesterase [Mycobacterium sp.]|uniref:sialate O-acetylesterase n=1 Tax=Mycobacterium sp. TaxID=1785 RepID=UPI002DA97304|nr:sialate O-acetylesterase [Mycobacterium sp.]
MTALRNPDGDYPLLRRLLIEGWCVVKRRLAKPGTPVTVPELPYLIVPILGQSNAYGMGVGLDLDGPDKPHPAVHQWAMSGPSAGTVVAGVDPLFHEVPGKGVGFGVTFAKQLADETGRSVLLIPGARGDTSFTPKNGYTWDVDDTRSRRNLYREAVSAVDAAIEQYPGSTVAAVLWHQGETDVPLMAAAVYQRKLDRLIDDVRGRYGESVPFLLGQMVPEEMELSHKDYSAIDAVHADTPNRRTGTAFIPGPSGCINGGEDRHYNATGQRELGRRMWITYREMCAEQLAGYAPG